MKKLAIVILICTFYIIFNYDEQSYKLESKKVFNSIMINRGNQIKDKIIGEIEIKSLNIRKKIKSGTSDNIIDYGYVGYVKESSELDSAFGNTILAGHNINSVFHKLHYIKLNAEVIIKTKKNTYSYLVYKKEVISTNNNDFYKIYNKYKILTLITCTKNKNERLIILAKKV